MRNLCLLFSIFACFAFFSFNVVLAQQDTIPPVVTLIDSAIIVVPCHSTYTEFGAEAVDDVDGILDVVIAGDCVCTSEAGSYIITYTAADNSGNSSTESRLVIVQGNCDVSCPYDNPDAPCPVVDEFPLGAFYAIDDFAQTPSNTTVDIFPLENEYPVNVTSLKLVAILTEPIHGIATIIDEEFIRYEPHLDFIGTDSILYRAQGNGLISDMASIYIEVGTTSIQANPIYPSIQIYPNPAKEFLNIDVGTDLASKQDIELLLFNTAGQLQSIHPISNIGVSRIAIEELQQGLYLFQLKTKREVLMNGKILVE